MAGSYGPRDAHVYDRWRRIQQRDVINELLHLQNQLETMRDCVLCFRSTVHTLDIDDAALLQVKATVLKVTQAMDEMRFCFRNVDRKVRSVAYNGPHGISDVYTQGSDGMTGAHYYYRIPTNQVYPTQSNIVYASDQRVPVSQTRSIPPTVVYNGELTDSQAYSAERLQFQEVPALEEMTPALDETAPVLEEMTPALEEIAHAVNEIAPVVEEINTSNRSAQEAAESYHTTEPAETLDGHYESLAEELPRSLGCRDAHVPESTCQTQNSIPEEDSKQIHEQTPDPYAQSGDTFEYLLDKTAVAESACEYVEDSLPYFEEEVSPEYLVGESSNVLPTSAAQESVHPPSSEITVDEVHFLTDRAEGLEYDDMIENSYPEPTLDETSVTASPTSHQPLGISTAETAQTSTEHDLRTDLGHSYPEDFVGATAERIAPEPSVISEAHPDFARDLVIDLPEEHIATDELNGEAEALYADSGRVETDQLTVPVDASCSELLLQTSAYRSGRESPECENGSLDGFHSPLPSEANPPCASKVPPEFCDIDGLTKSLEELWSLDETSHKSNGGSLPIQCIPQFGKIPKRISEFRMPPPLKYVPAIVSYCADDGFYMQLMEDEKAMLKVDSLIERGTQSAPLKFSEVQPGDFVLCMYALDNRFYRAQLLKAAGDDKFEVRFIDYGNTCVASVRDMRRIPRSARSFGQCAVRSDFSEKLKENAEEIKSALELVSLQTYFLACFAQDYVDCDREPPVFMLIDIQKIDGISVLQVPPPLSLKPSDTKFLVRNLELGTLGTVKLDLVEDLERKKKVAEMLRIGPNLPCKGNRVKEGSLVAYKYQRARVTKCASSTQLSLELIDEFQNELTDVPLSECSFLPLATVKVPPAASCIVRVSDHQDMEVLDELCHSGDDIQMTVVGTNVLPKVEFSRIVNGSSEEVANTGI